MSELVFCEQCGGQIPAKAKFCRSCGAAQELTSEDSERGGGAAQASPAAVSSSDLGEKVDGLRRLTEQELAARANAAFPGRSWQQVAGTSIGGGVAAFAAAWGITWMILRALGGDQAVGMLPLDQIARFGVDLSLGAPLILSGNISSIGGETELRLPLTLLVLIPLTGLTIGGYLAASWFRPASRVEGWKIGATIAVPFAVVLFFFGVSFAAEVPIVSPSFDGSEFGIGGSSASTEIHADALYTVLYGLFWGVLGGAFGGWLNARRYCPPGDPRAALTRTYGSTSPTVVVESAVRALGIPLLGFSALGAIGCIVVAATEESSGLLALLLVPTLAIAALFVVQGIGYEVEGYVSLGGLAGDTTQSTFHAWDNPIALIVAAALALPVIVGLVRGGRRIVHATPPGGEGGAIRAGAAIALPWLGLLLLLRGLGSLTLTATGLGVLQGAGKVDPAFGETILFGTLFGAVCGGLGGWLAWRERQIVAGESAARDPVATPLARRVLGDLDADLPDVLPGPLLQPTPPGPELERASAAAPPPPPPPPPLPEPAPPPPPPPPRAMPARDAATPPIDEATGGGWLSRRRLLLSGIAALLLAAGALGVLLIGDSGSGTGESVAAGDDIAGETELVDGADRQSTYSEGGAPACDKAEAERQMSEGPLAEALQDEFGTSIDPGDNFFSQLVACADLDGDEVEEMVVQGLPPTSGGPTPWAILTPVEGSWEPVLTRASIPVRSLSIEEGAVREISAAFAVEDPLCCPSHERSGVIAWTGDSFEYMPDGGSLVRTILITSDGAPARLGELELSTTHLGVAKALWGPPTNISADGYTVCRASWADLGLRITFANFGAAGACGAAGRVSSLELEGETAAQAGWEVPGGLRIGASLRQTLDDYPEASRGEYESGEEGGCSGTPYVLRTMPFIGEKTPSLLAYPNEAVVHCIRLSPYAAGE